MKNIAQKSIKPKNQTECVKRINRNTKAFRSARRSQQFRIIDRLAYEANLMQDSAVKGWLNQFQSILKGSR
jgi:hypothetical protein